MYILKWRGTFGGYFGSGGFGRQTVARQKDATRFQTREEARAAVEPMMLARKQFGGVGWVVVRLVRR